MDTHHLTIFYEGHVQGVGFRYAAMQIAREFEVAGFVQNLDDGRVVVEAEGSAAEVAAFAAMVEDRMQGFIRKANRSGHVRAAQFTGFVIR